MRIELVYTIHDSEKLKDGSSTLTIRVILTRDWFVMYIDTGKGYNLRGEKEETLKLIEYRRITCISPNNNLLRNIEYLPILRIHIISI